MDQILELEQTLELEQIQGSVLRERPMPYVGAYLLLEIDDAGDARALLQRLRPHVTSAADWQAPADRAWLNIVFTHDGLAALGVPASILDGFAPEFRSPMSARKQFLGDVGESDPANWDLVAEGGHFHVGLLLMAPDSESFAAKLALGDRAMAGLGVHRVGRIDVLTPENLREHFGYVDGISRPFIEGQGGQPTPGQGEPFKAGEFVLGYLNELGRMATGPGPEILWRNGTYLSIRKLHQKVAEFRRWLSANAADKDDQELLAAKLVGRWRSGCPLALSPDHDDPAIAADPMRVNDFAYYDDDLEGVVTPVGCHIRRVNPRDALRDTITDPRLHRLLRRGAAYGPMLPDGVLDDGVARGVVLSFVNADPGRQFEFVQSQWVNDGDFVSAGGDRDPIAGNHEPGHDDYRYPAHRLRRHLRGLPAFVVTKGGAHVFLPSLGALEWLAEGNYDSNPNAVREMERKP